MRELKKSTALSLRKFFEQRFQQRFDAGPVFTQHRESKRPEDLVRKLDRVECAVLNYPPVTDTSMVVNTAVEVLPILSPFFAFLTAPG